MFEARLAVAAVPRGPEPADVHVPTAIQGRRSSSAEISWSQRMSLLPTLLNGPGYTLGVLRPVTAEITKRIRKTTKQTCAAHDAVPARPPNPRTAAINAIIRKVSAQDNMIWLPSMLGVRRGMTSRTTRWLHPSSLVRSFRPMLEFTGPERRTGIATGMPRQDEDVADDV